MGNEIAFWKEAKASDRNYRPGDSRLFSNFDLGICDIRMYDVHNIIIVLQLNEICEIFRSMLVYRTHSMTTFSSPLLMPLAALNHVDKYLNMRVCDCSKKYSRLICHKAKIYDRNLHELFHIKHWGDNLTIHATLFMLFMHVHSFHSFVHAWLNMQRLFNRCNFIEFQSLKKWIWGDNEMVI